MELRLPDQVYDRLAAIAVEIEAELRLRAGIRPLDAAGGVEHDDPVRNRLGRLAEAVDRQLEVALVRGAQPGPAEDRGARVGPDAPPLGRQRVERLPGHSVTRWMCQRWRPMIASAPAPSTASAHAAPAAAHVTSVATATPARSGRSETHGSSRNGEAVAAPPDGLDRLAIQAVRLEREL